MRSLTGLIVLILGLHVPTLHGQFTLAPAIAVEAEEFTVESDWKVIQNGQGNYMVDMIGFNHISGERLLSLDSTRKSGRASTTVQVPRTGKYRLWVRYEYPPFGETRFRVQVQQAGKTVAEQVMGKKENIRYAGFSGKIEAKAQHDPSWGPEGAIEEVLSIADLKVGPATIALEGVAQPQLPGRSANRNIDLIYLTSDTEDAWLKHYGRTTNYYPILDAFRDTRGPRWEVRVRNRRDTKDSYRIHHVYNRVPWGFSDPATLNADGKAASDWVGLRGQDTAHFSLVQISGVGAFDVEIRPAGGKEAVKTISGIDVVRFYLPPYPRWKELPRTPEEAIDAILADLQRHKAPGKKPTKPLCYGGWMPLGQDNDYGRRYAELYVALGMRALHPALSGPAQRKNLEARGVVPSRSWMVMAYRNPPTAVNITRARAELEREKMSDYLRFFDYGDEIAFSEWLGMMIEDELARDRKRTAREVITQKWAEWLKVHRPEQQLKEYWLPTWGPFTLSFFRPDSSAEAARVNPRLYVDSLLFYEDMAMRFAADGARAVRAALGEEVLCGANYSCHPFYYPHSTMYIKWFRRGAADLGRHSEYFWQVAQAGPMINGYISEHFRSGMRDNPRAVLRQYTMPHAPGNTDASFVRSAFSHLAHGATLLDFFGIGLNECFTENHIDHRAISRFRALRDVTHSVGFIEDRLPQARAVPSSVALLISESTERWDHAGTATDRAGHAHFGPDFRKTRLHFHLERLGIWKALTFAGLSPDLVTEEDVIAGKLKGYRMVVLVGDHWPRTMIPVIERWVQEGGVALATAASGQKDIYGTAMKDWHALAGLKSVKTEPRTTFLRPRQELAFLEPIDAMIWEEPTATKTRRSMPILATRERIEPEKGSKVLARFQSDNSPAWVERALGKGSVFYVAGHPGLAMLWTALQPPVVPDRGPSAHAVPTNWDQAAQAVLARISARSGAKAQFLVSESKPRSWLDARLLEAPGGYLFPMANYSEKVGEKVRLHVTVPRKVRRVASAYHGELAFTQEKELVSVTLPALSYGDVLRFDQ